MERLNVSSCGVTPRTNIEVPEEALPHYWHREKAYWSIIKPLGEPVTNLICNPSFEADLNGWGSPNATILTRTLGAGVFGDYGLVLTAPPPSGTNMVIGYGANFPWPNTCPPMFVPAGSDVYACAWVRGTLGDRISLAFSSDGLPLLPGNLPFATITANGQWQQICHTLHLPAFPAGFIPFGLQITNDNANDSNTMQVDGVIATVAQVTQYFDGDFQDAIWSGAPHASESIVTQFASAYGEKIDFATLGLDIYTDEGWGLPPVENVSTSFARLDGADFQRQKVMPRTITLTGSITSCAGDPFELHAKRRRIADALTYRFKRQCNEELILCYQLVDNCGNPLSTELQIPVVYQGGMGGIRRLQSEERMILQLTSYRQPWFRTPFRTTAPLVPRSNATPANINDLVTYNGSEDSWPIITIYGDPGAPTQIERIANDTLGTTITMGVPTIGFIIPAGMRLLIDVSLGPRATLSPLPGFPGTTTDVTSQINWVLSDGQQFRLVPGRNFVRTLSGGNLPPQASISWHENHLSADYVQFTRRCRNQGANP